MLIAFSVFALGGSTMYAMAQTSAKASASPRRLLISVAQDTSSDGAHRGGETVTGSAGTSGRDGIQARVYDTRSLDNARVMQTVQVLEGRSAYIQTAGAVPVPQQRWVGQSVVNGRVYGQVGRGVEYVEAATGFYVTPRVSGNQVTLEISPQHETLIQRAPGAVETQHVTSTVSGRMGEWIELAAMSQERTPERDVLLGRASSTRSETRSVRVKVEELR